MHSVIISLPVAIFFVGLFPYENVALNLPPPPPPGKNMVIVVHNDDENRRSLPTPAGETMMFSESQTNAKRVERKTVRTIPGIKRQGQVLGKQTNGGVSIEDSNGNGGKKEKSLLRKLLPTAARHIGGPSDIFRKHFKKNPGIGEKRVIGHPLPNVMDFRPHQPDITPDMQNGKLSLPVGFTDDPLGLKARPTPMANKINPYTNGVANSFPPGIDPYEGFIRYAAENLDTPAGNIIDYHSLEHYYGPQHPLSPHHSKDPTVNHPYADSFSYSNNNLDTSNSPPPHQHPEGFRSHNNPHADPGPAERNNHINSLNSFEHGIDHFHAPSPGLEAAPPRPRPLPPTEGAFEEGHGHRSPPFEPNSPDHHSFHQNHHGAPFKQSTTSGIGDRGPHPIPDIDPLYEGPPSSHPHIPLPDADELNHHPPPPPPHDETSHNTQDGGDDAIWGILDLAEMLEKGQIPGQQKPGDNKIQNSPPQSHKNSHGRVVMPIYTRAPPPRGSSPASEGVPQPYLDDPEAPSQNPQKFAYNPEGFDYDDPSGSPEAGQFPPGPEGGQFPGGPEGGQFPGGPDAGQYPGGPDGGSQYQANPNKQPQHQQYSPYESHESNNDYTDDVYRR